MAEFLHSAPHQAPLPLQSAFFCRHKQQWLLSRYHLSICSHIQVGSLVHIMVWKEIMSLFSDLGQASCCWGLTNCHWNNDFSGRNITDERFFLCNQDSVWVLGCVWSTFHSKTSVFSVSVFYIHPLFPLVLLIPSESILVCFRVLRVLLGLVSDNLTVIMKLRKFSSPTLLTILRTNRSSLEQGSRQSLSKNFFHIYLWLLCACMWQLKRSLLWACGS